MSYVYTPKYFIYLFKDGKRKKKLYSCATYDMANKKYNTFLNKDKPLFTKKYTYGKWCEYEIALLTTKDVEPTEIYKKDELGRNVVVETKIDKFTMLKLDHYEIPEKIYDYRINDFIYGEDLYEFIKSFKSLILVYTLNTYLFVQEDDKVYGFGLKNKFESRRLIRSLEKQIIKDGLINIMCIRDRSLRQKKNLYDLLEKNGFNRVKLYKQYSY